MYRSQQITTNIDSIYRRDECTSSLTHSFLYFYENPQAFRKRLAFKIKCEQQDDQCQANDTPVETICFVENPKNRHHLYKPV